MRKLVTVMALFVVSLLTLSMVSALDANNLEWGEIEVNGHKHKIKIKILEYFINVIYLKIFF